MSFIPTDENLDKDVDPVAIQKLKTKKLEQIKNEIAALESTSATVTASEKLVNKLSEFNARSPRIRLILWVTLSTVVLAFFVSYKIFISKPEFVRISIVFINSIFNTSLLKYIIVGFAAQIVDGALGMAYGATCSSFLMGLGVPAATASASIHIAEIFTTGASGLAHFRFGNVNKKLFRYLLFSGMAGAVAGAYLLSDQLDDKLIRPFIAAYLLILGIIIIRKALIRQQRKKKVKNLGWLAGFGGFMDAIGGGGWGPIVTSSLLSTGRSASYTIGSVNLAEFFIAFAGAGTFLLFTGISGWQAIIGLIIGGIFAAPCAALLVSRVRRKPLMIFVGTLIVIVSITTFIKSNIPYVVNRIQRSYKTF